MEHLLSTLTDMNFCNTAIPFNCLGPVIILWLLNTSQRELLESLIGNQSSWKAYDGGGGVDSISVGCALIFSVAC